MKLSGLIVMHESSVRAEQSGTSGCDCPSVQSSGFSCPRKSQLAGEHSLVAVENRSRVSTVKKLNPDGKFSGGCNCVVLPSVLRRALNGARFGMTKLCEEKLFT